MQVFITANSPGEISGWVRPVVEELKKKSPEASVTVVITPCQYASGAEMSVAEGTPGVDEAVRLWPLVRKSIFSKEKPPKGSCVLFLGGDAFYAVLLSRTLKIPALAYMPKPRWRGSISRYLVPDENMKSRFKKAGVADEKVEVVGRLETESVNVSGTPSDIRSRKGLSDVEVVTLLPGSRPFELETMLPFFIKTAEAMNKLVEGRIYFLVFSPFANRDKITQILEKEGLLFTSDEIDTPGGCRVRMIWDGGHDIMSVSKLAVTVPGTNNLQLAAMGVPMLVVVPLDNAHKIPVDGIFGLLNADIPPIGYLKKQMLVRKARSLPYVSLPNIIAGKVIVPEMVDFIKPEDVAERAALLLSEDAVLEQMERDLKTVAGERGAAGRIADAVLNI